MNKTQCAKDDRGVRNGLPSKFKHNNIRCRNNHKLKDMYTNTDQFLIKRDELVESITGNEPDIIIIMEVIPKAQLNSLWSSLVGNRWLCYTYQFRPIWSKSGCVKNTWCCDIYKGRFKCWRSRIYNWLQRSYLGRNIFNSSGHVTNDAFTEALPRRRMQHWTVQFKFASYYPRQLSWKAHADLRWF